MPTEIKAQKTIYEDLQDIRVQMLKEATKKSGYNKNLNFNYFELGDFVPAATKLFAEKGMCPVFSITYDANLGTEMAILTLIKGAERIMFTCPVERPAHMTGTQSVGAVVTYYRRYMYQICLDLVENEILDATLTNEVKPTIEEKKATVKQIETIKKMYSEERMANMMAYYKVDALEDLTLKQASEAIDRAKND